jgi:hypothetical protein
MGMMMGRKGGDVQTRLGADLQTDKKSVYLADVSWCSRLHGLHQLADYDAVTAHDVSTSTSSCGTAGSFRARHITRCAPSKRSLIGQRKNAQARCHVCARNARDVPICLYSSCFQVQGGAIRSD